MLLRRDTLDGIAHGRITLQFRRWKRPTVRAGGTLLTAIGQLAIDAVDPIGDVAAVSEADARAAGFDDLAALEAALRGRSEGTIYRVALRLLGPDPRVALREKRPSAAELAEIATQLERWDRSSPIGAWTHRTLTAIERYPAVRALDLAAEAEVDGVRFKANVRKLKSLGLTESLEVGYRLSARGRAVLDDLDRGAS